jgi:hypothetical protein
MFEMFDTCSDVTEWDVNETVAGGLLANNCILCTTNLGDDIDMPVHDMYDTTNRDLLVLGTTISLESIRQKVKRTLRDTGETRKYH